MCVYLHARALRMGAREHAYARACSWVRVSVRVSGVRACRVRVHLRACACVRVCHCACKCVRACTSACFMRMIILKRCGCAPCACQAHPSALTTNNTETTWTQVRPNKLIATNREKIKSRKALLFCFSFQCRCCNGPVECDATNAHRRSEEPPE